MGSANFMEMQQQIQSGMMGNPDFMRQVMDSPLTQSLMSNPEILRGLIQSNPQMREVTFINRKNINDNLKSFFKKTKFYFNFWQIHYRLLDWVKQPLNSLICRYIKYFWKLPEFKLKFKEITLEFEISKVYTLLF